MPYQPLANGSSEVDCYSVSSGGRHVLIKGLKSQLKSLPTPPKERG